MLICMYIINLSCFRVITLKRMDKKSGFKTICEWQIGFSNRANRQQYAKNEDGPRQAIVGQAKEMTARDIRFRNLQTSEKLGIPPLPIPSPSYFSLNTITFLGSTGRCIVAVCRCARYCHRKLFIVFYLDVDSLSMWLYLCVVTTKMPT